MKNFKVSARLKRQLACHLATQRYGEKINELYATILKLLNYRIENDENTKLIDKVLSGIKNIKEHSALMDRLKKSNSCKVVYIDGAHVTYYTFTLDHWAYVNPKLDADYVRCPAESPSDLHARITEWRSLKESLRMLEIKVAAALAPMTTAQEIATAFPELTVLLENYKPTSKKKVAPKRLTEAELKAIRKELQGDKDEHRDNL